MNNETLSRLDTALRLLADVTQELHALRALVVDQEPEYPQEPSVTLARLSQNAQTLVSIWGSLATLGHAVTATDLLNAAWIYYPRGDADKRDTREINAKRDIRMLVEKGIFIERFGGELILSSTEYLQENANK